jgi:CubicO group peptidase (beta-lactamase class C family)
VPLSVAALLLTLAGPATDGLPVASAEQLRSLRVARERLEVIDRIVQKGRDAGGYPGAAVVVGRGGYSVVSRGYGTLDWTPASAAVDADRTIYDLASLTKVVATTTALMLLVDDGLIDLDAPVARYLPAFGEGDPAKAAVTVTQLLTHHAGLPAGRDLWRSANSVAEARAQLLTTRLVCPPGRCYIYSDIGADVLGFLAEQVSGQPLDRLLEARVFGPLGMRDTGFRPAEALRSRIAPTEPWSRRGYPLRGEVHDENAYVLGGVAGHAGLFATAADLGLFAQLMLDRGRLGERQLIRAETVDRFTRRTAGHRALGWDTCDRGVGDGESRGDPTCGRLFSPRAFGHTGFTGTSLWIDPDRDLFVVLLTNRVHAARVRRPSQLIHDIRADVADAATVALTDVSDDAVVRRTAFRADVQSAGWNPPVRSRRARGRGVKSRSARSRSAKVARPAAAGARSRTATAKARTATTAKKAKGGSASRRTAGAKATTKATTKAKATTTAKRSAARSKRTG